ncbi:MAG: histidine phosphatase family protein [Chloroflexota bacterium]|nr:histidine phosphatase family protein [Chloroflexota bacterium]
MRLILARHGETDWNHDRRVLGHTDIELNERGRRQAAGLAEALKGERPDAIFSSPLRRARETAELIARHHTVDVELDSGLMELNAGDMEGFTYPQMVEGYSEFMKSWIEDATSMELPGGESLHQVQQRAWQVVERIRQRYADGVVVLVSHNFVILSIICQALDMPLTLFRRLRLSLGSISIVNFGRRGNSLLLFNDTCHHGEEREL